jgi:hypothetical protein
MPNDAAAEKSGSAKHGHDATIRCHHDSNSPDCGDHCSSPYALPAPLGMAGCFELLLNREQKPSETEFVAVKAY